MTINSPYKQDPNPLTVIQVSLTCVIAGGVIGASMNGINGYISPIYFQNILGWDFQEIWTASIAQGIFEGLIYGVIFSIVFGATFAVVTKGRATYQFAIQNLTIPIGLVYFCWALGGVIAMPLAALSPEFYQQSFIGVPDDFGQMLGYAWVGGSIWGGMFGGLLGLILGVLGVRTSWNKEMKNETTITENG